MTGSYPDCTDSREVFLFDHSTPESDLDQTSRYKVTPESNIKITKEKKKKRKKALDCYTNSPRRHCRKCLEKSKENVNNNVKGLTSGKAAFLTESREQIRL